MDKHTLAERFRRAHTLTISCAREYVVQTLPDEVRFLLHPNQSYDGNPLAEGEVTFPEERLPSNKYLGPLTEEEVLAWLWRGGKVPEWVNLAVEAQDEHFTYIELLCCGRFTDREGLLYHQREGHSPFHVLGPVLPSEWKSLEESGKFDLYWHGRNVL